jgi:putative hydrolase of the HAD superfamily
MIRAVLFDFGGVILSSPFDAFAAYERDHGLPDGFIRRLNATNPDDNAWAKLERSEVDLDGFAELFEAEARAAGHEVDGRAVLALLGGAVRPQMVEALRRCSERLRTGLLTNNFVSMAPEGEALPPDPTGRREQIAGIMELFDVIVESSRVGVRKPDPRFYEMACELLDIEPHEAVFLDDLGINLKPARAMGMTTIKVLDPDEAIAELEAVVGFPLRD